MYCYNVIFCLGYYMLSSSNSKVVMKPYNFLIQRMGKDNQYLITTCGSVIFK